MSSSCQNTDPGWQVHQWVCWLLPFRAACRNHRNCELRTSTDGERRPCVSYITKTAFSKLWWHWHFIFGSLPLELYDFYLQGNGFKIQVENSSRRWGPGEIVHQVWPAVDLGTLYGTWHIVNAQLLSVGWLSKDSKAVSWWSGVRPGFLFAQGWGGEVVVVSNWGIHRVREGNPSVCCYFWCFFFEQPKAS